MTKDALKPCPFCGSRVEVVKHMVNTNTGGLGDYPIYGVSCNYPCGTSKSEDTEEKVIKAWNTRTQQPCVDVEAFTDELGEIMQLEWNEWCEDTGYFPDDFEWQGGNGKLYFTASKWVANIARRLLERGLIGGLPEIEGLEEAVAHYESLYGSEEYQELTKAQARLALLWYAAKAYQERSKGDA